MKVKVIFLHIPGIHILKVLCVKQINVNKGLHTQQEIAVGQENLSLSLNMQRFV